MLMFQGGGQYILLRGHFGFLLWMLALSILSEHSELNLQDRLVLQEDYRMGKVILAKL